ncbi:peptidoglycan-binding protein [Patescibacteria group bacterium]|nr:peptidoglycan-binding protein [Patescibacteria group bacterium]
MTGNFPHGVNGEFTGVSSVAGAGTFPLIISTNRNAQIGTFSLVIVEGMPEQLASEVVCQYSLQVLAPPPLPSSPPPPEEEVQKETFEQLSPLLIAGKELSFGSRGIEVTKLQALLASDPSLYPEGLVTGWYGPLTTEAVWRFQEKVGIVPSGEVDEATQLKLNELREEVSLTPFQFQSYLIFGVRGNSVVILQNILKQLEFFPEDVDSTGYFGSITEVAVQAYQENRGIETTGTVGPITRAALNQE